MVILSFFQPLDGGTGRRLTTPEKSAAIGVLHRTRIVATLMASSSIVAIRVWAGATATTGVRSALFQNKAQRIRFIRFISPGLKSPGLFLTYTVSYLQQSGHINGQAEDVLLLP